MCFDDEQKVLMKNKTLDLKKNKLKSLELRNKTVRARNVHDCIHNVCRTQLTYVKYGATYVMYSLRQTESTGAQNNIREENTMHVNHLQHMSSTQNVHHLGLNMINVCWNIRDVC